MFAPCGHGEVAEWLKAPHSKCGIRVTVSGVRIPPSPPFTLQLCFIINDLRTKSGDGPQNGPQIRPWGDPDRRDHVSDAGLVPAHVIENRLDGVREDAPAGPAPLKRTGRRFPKTQIGKHMGSASEVLCAVVDLGARASRSASASRASARSGHDQSAWLRVALSSSRAQEVFHRAKGRTLYCSWRRLALTALTAHSATNARSPQRSPQCAPTRRFLSLPSHMTAGSGALVAG